MAKVDPPVEPLESADEAPASNAELCWNCTNHGESNPLDKKGVCKVCGFEKDKLYNADIEYDKAEKRRLAVEARNNK